MYAKIAVMSFLAVAIALCGFLDVEAQDKKKRMGNLTGVLKSTMPSKNGKNVVVEILAAGEEKARTYRVGYDPVAKAPIKKVLDAVRAAKVGDRVEAAWFDSGEGLALTSFSVLKKSNPDKK